MRTIPMFVLCLGVTFAAVIGSVHSDAMSALHDEILADNREEVKRLIDSGANVNAKNVKGDTPIFYAAEFGKAKIIELLTDAGANVNLVNNRGISPLLIAVRNDETEAVEVLLKKNANANADSILHYKCYESIVGAGLLEKYQSVLPHIELTSVGVAGISPLHVAVNKVNKIVEDLLEHGANVDAGNSFRATPLHLASLSGRKEVVELLITKGAQVNNVDIAKYTPLHFAANNGHDEVVELLIKKGASIDPKDLDGKTPLHLASKNHHKKVAQILIEHGADENSKDNDGKTPSEYAAE